MKTKKLLEQVLKALEDQQKVLLRIIQDERKERRELIDRFMSRSLPEFKTYATGGEDEKFEEPPPDADEDLIGEVTDDDFSQ